MGDSEDTPAPAADGIPAWQRRRGGEPDDQAAPDAQPHPQLQVVRRFLDDDEIKGASRDKKVEFLRSKGLPDGDIESLLGEIEAAAQSNHKHAEKTITGSKATSPVQESPTLTGSGGDRPPIVTYPEFLAKPQRPPPLVTTNGLLATLYAFAGLSTLLYGTSKHVVAPMVESLTDAQSELYGTAAKRLHALISKLEKTVSEVPLTKTQLVDGADDVSDADDPTEMFHRDVGTQTSSLSASPTAALANESESKRQADRLSTATKALSALENQIRAQSEDLESTGTLLDVFRGDLHGMTYGGQTQLAARYDVYGVAKKTEPEDEIRKVRDNIRRVKGVLLSTRNFPASTR